MEDVLTSRRIGKPLHEGSVGFLDGSLHELLTKVCLGRTISGEQDHTGCFLVETVNNVWAGSVGVCFFPVIPEQVDQTHRTGIPSFADGAETGGFGHRAKVRILVQDLQ